MTYLSWRPYFALWPMHCGRPQDNGILETECIHGGQRKATEGVEAGG